MVKLQHTIGNPTGSLQRWFPLWHGKVATLSGQLSAATSLSSFRFGMVKLQQDKKQAARKTATSFRFGMVKLQR